MFTPACCCCCCCCCFFFFFFFYGCTAPAVLGRFFSSLIYTLSVGLLGRGISPSQGRYLHTGQHKHRINAHRHPCLEWNSNPRSQRSSERRQFMRKTALLEKPCSRLLLNPGRPTRSPSLYRLSY
jgi:hypothetical protein